MHATRGAETERRLERILIHVNVPVAPSPADMFTSATYGNGLVLSWRNTFAGGAPTGLTLDVAGSATTQIPLGVSESLVVSSAPAGTYTLRLRSTNSGGASAYSSAVIVTLPAPCVGLPEVPSNVLAYRIGNTAYVVWDPPATGPAVSGYVLYVTGSFNGSFATTGRALSGQVGPGSYTVTVVAQSPCGSSARSAPRDDRGALGKEKSAVGSWQ